MGTGPREDRGDIAILISPHHENPEKVGFDIAIFIYPHHGDAEKVGVM